MGSNEIIESVFYRSYHSGKDQMRLFHRADPCSQYALRGCCPHCSVASLCDPVAPPYKFNSRQTVQENGDGECVITQCPNCLKFVLLVTIKGKLNKYYPRGRANDSVDPAVPEEIATDFKEALRCLHVGSYRATVTMCRRAIQSSSKDLGAVGKNLVDQIDYLANKGKITEPLKEMAHEIRSVGNVGAHPDDDPLKDVNEQDASEIVEFMSEYFNHVYVMPEKLKAMKERRPVEDS